MLFTINISFTSLLSYLNILFSSESERLYYQYKDIYTYEEFLLIFDAGAGN